MRIKLVYLLMLGILCILNRQALSVSDVMIANNAGNTFIESKFEFIWIGGPRAPETPILQVVLFAVTGQWQWLSRR